MPDRLLSLLSGLPLLLSPGLGPPATTVAPAPVTTPVPSAQGVWPVQPPDVVRGFDPPDSAYGAGHRGVDLGSRVGELVHTALAGRVTFAGTLAGRGVVVVDHGAVRTTYEPVAPVVSIGQEVARGEVVGRLTRVQSHCFPAACLHWGLLRNSDDVYLDPLTLVGRAPVRLLPLWRDLPWPG